MPNRLKMFSTERIALLLLALAICVYIIILLIGKVTHEHSTPATAIEGDMQSADSMVVFVPPTELKSSPKSHASDTVSIQPKAKNTKAKTKKHNDRPAKDKKQVKHRDHLNEPVEW